MDRITEFIDEYMDEFSFNLISIKLFPVRTQW